MTLSTQDNSKLLQQLKSGFKKVNQIINHLVEPSLHGVNRLFVLVLENDTQRTSHSGYYLPNVEIKHYDVMINGENLFDQPVTKIKNI